ncbi:MAG: DUF362 domain-containing protein [Planctomycetota bacterium]|jgi:uncharacterized protein (DUF362 family)
MHKCNRREFLKKGVAASAAIPLFYPCGKLIAGEKEDEEKEKEDPPKSSKSSKKKKKISSSQLKKTLAVAKGDDPGKMTHAAIETLGGMSRFVKKNNVVVVKPNIGWNRTPEEAANTNPDVVAAIVKDCLKAGAKEVKVFDRTCSNAKMTYERSGIAKAAEDAGAKVSFIDNSRFRDTKIPGGVDLKSWQLYADVLDADVFINVPIAKHHGIAKLTMGIKNLMGIMGGSRGKIHRGIDTKLVDIISAAKPHLTILDAYRILLAKGPQGGGTTHVRKAGKIVAGVDFVAVDAYGVTIFNDYEGWKGTKPESLGFIRKAYERRMGEMRLNKLKIVEC